MLEGKCPHCGARYYGWALSNPGDKICSRCGETLEIGESRGWIPEDDPPAADWNISPSGDTRCPEPGDDEQDTVKDK
jgi:hypothetical protein